MKSLESGVTIAINLDIHVKPVGSFMENLRIGKVLSKYQDLDKMIGCARMIGGLYYFDEVLASHEQV
ncbi:hypothetical protein E5676_scaffold216G00500 [Cucumis melo var. makuwa]|uniref:Uncharacterized protein n=1 Tax=Cucumis melo var. makuwa TaxID=1194695 RepID=A0A5D3E1V3_CUCMM|nr:hypothetical protein E5676_scaffold216G00500 [Cucumis melo var. makuwa]